MEAFPSFSISYSFPPGPSAVQAWQWCCPVWQLVQQEHRGLGCHLHLEQNFPFLLIDQKYSIRSYYLCYPHWRLQCTCYSGSLATFNQNINTLTSYGFKMSPVHTVGDVNLGIQVKDWLQVIHPQRSGRRVWHLCNFTHCHSESSAAYVLGYSNRSLLSLTKLQVSSEALLFPSPLRPSPIMVFFYNFSCIEYCWTNWSSSSV